MDRHQTRLARRALPFVALALLLPITLPTAAAEGPSEMACDATEQLVCAGVEAGAGVQCSVGSTGVTQCNFAYGWLARAYSPIGLSGSETHAIHAVVETCWRNEPCVQTLREETRECAWIATMECNEVSPVTTGHRRSVLAPGECVTVTVTVDLTIQAQVPPLLALAEATASDQHVAIGTACF